jgi:hypothetical protein
MQATITAYSVSICNPRRAWFKNTTVLQKTSKRRNQRDDEEQTAKERTAIEVSKTQVPK